MENIWILYISVQLLSMCLLLNTYSSMSHLCRSHFHSTVTSSWTRCFLGYWFCSNNLNERKNDEKQENNHGIHTSMKFPLKTSSNVTGKSTTKSPPRGTWACPSSLEPPKWKKSPKKLKKINFFPIIYSHKFTLKMGHGMNRHHLVVLNLLHHVYHKFFVYQHPIMSVREKDNQIFSKILFNCSLLHKLLLNLENAPELLDHFYSYPDVILSLIFGRIFWFDSMSLF